MELSLRDCFWNEISTCGVRIDQNPFTRVYIAPRHRDLIFLQPLLSICIWTTFASHTQRNVPRRKFLWCRWICSGVSNVPLLQNHQIFKAVISARFNINFLNSIMDSLEKCTTCHYSLLILSQEDNPTGVSSYPENLLQSNHPAMIHLHWVEDEQRGHPALLLCIPWNSNRFWANF